MNKILTVVIGVSLVLGSLNAMSYDEAQKMLKEERAYNKTHSVKKTAGQLQADKYRKRLEREYQQNNNYGYSKPKKSYY